MNLIRMQIDATPNTLIPTYPNPQKLVDDNITQGQ